MGASERLNIKQNTTYHTYDHKINTHAYLILVGGVRIIRIVGVKITAAIATTTATRQRTKNGK